MYLKFLKDHVGGLKKGQFAKCDSGFGARMIDGGFAEEVTEAEAKGLKPAKKAAPKKKKKADK